MTRAAVVVMDGLHVARLAVAVARGFIATSVAFLASVSSRVAASQLYRALIIAVEGLLRSLVGRAKEVHAGTGLQGRCRDRLGPVGLEVGVVARGSESVASFVSLASSW